MRKNAFAIGVAVGAVSILIAGCAQTAHYKPVGQEGAGSSIAGAYWNQGTIASWKIDRGDRVYVCLDTSCKEGAPQHIRKFLESRGLATADTPKDARYQMKLRTFVTRQVNTKNGETIVAPINAWPLIGNEAADEVPKLKPWMKPGGQINHENVAGGIKKAGMNAFALVTNNFVIYDSLNNQTGQLAQTIGGGSPGAYIAGFMLAPIMNAVFANKAANEMMEGLAGFEATITPVEGSFKTIRITYGFAASSSEENPRALIEAAVDQAIEGIRSYAEIVPEGAEVGWTVTNSSDSIFPAYLSTVAGECYRGWSLDEMPKQSCWSNKSQ